MSYTFPRSSKEEQAAMDAAAMPTVARLISLLREAAQQVVDECGPNMPPSNGAIEKLRATLLAYMEIAP